MLHHTQLILKTKRSTRLLIDDIYIQKVKPQFIPADINNRDNVKNRRKRRRKQKNSPSKNLRLNNCMLHF